MKLKRGNIIYLKHDGTDNKKRPFIIVSNDIGNYYAPHVLCVPITSRKKRLDLQTHCIVNYHSSMALCEQIHTFKKNEIMCVVGTINKNSMKKVNECLLISLGVSKECSTEDM